MENQTTESMVSVVIPTRHRPSQVQNAVRSALQQSYRSLEVLVVIDGPDQETGFALRAIDDPRLKVISLPEHRGGSYARNAGVSAACGQWVAFLDDDDEWLPNKLARQVARAQADDETDLILGCSVIARRPGNDSIWPRRFPDSTEPLSEYLFCRRGFTEGDACLQTSTLFVPRQLLLEVPFQQGLAKHQDWDWLLRVSGRPGARIEVIAEPLAIFHIEGRRSSVSRRFDWEQSLSWALASRSRMTGRAFSYFVACQCVTQSEGSSMRPRAIRRLVREFLFHGSPTLHSSALFLIFLAFPLVLRRKVRDVARACKARLFLRAYQPEPAR